MLDEKTKEQKMSTSKSNQEFLLEIKEKTQILISFPNGNLEMINGLKQCLNELEDNIENELSENLQNVIHALDNEINNYHIKIKKFENLKNTMIALEEFSGLKFENNENLKLRLKNLENLFDRISIEIIDEQLEEFQPMINIMNEKLELFEEVKILMGEIDYFVKNNQLKWANMQSEWDIKIPLEIRISSLREILSDTPVELIHQYIHKWKNLLKGVKKDSNLIN